MQDDNDLTPEELDRARRDPYSAHEALDRSHLAATFFEENVARHPYVRAHDELKATADDLADRLADFYQQLGRFPGATASAPLRPERPAAEHGDE